MKPSIFRSFIIAASLALLPLMGRAGPLLPSAPMLGGGWAYDVVPGSEAGVWTPSSLSIKADYVFNLSGPAVFRITDAYNFGDSFRVSDNGGAWMLTSSGIDPVDANVLFTADEAWASPNYAHGEFELKAGQHQLVIEGNLPGNDPAGFFTRIDSVPDAGSLAAMVAFLWAGLFGVRRLRRRG